MTQFGLSVALLTPFDGDGGLDGGRLGRHAADLMRRGAAGVTLYGTTGEGASIAADERPAGIDALLAAGLPADRVTLGLAANATGDALAQIRQGHARGLARFLVPPPFYYTPVVEDGLADWYGAVLRDAPGDAGLILYHIPQVTGVALSPGLMARLESAFPGRIAAIKDSSGDWAAARAFLDVGTVPVLVGDERLLHRAVGAGAAGSISGMANLYPERLARILATGAEDPALSACVDRVVARPVVPALKALMARAAGDPGWHDPRPPLEPLARADEAALLAAGLPETADG